MDTSKLPAPAAQTIDFSKDIQPILANSCLRCHGPEEPHSHFRLDNRVSALKGGDGGIDVISGDSAKSPLIWFVAGLSPNIDMPPEGKGDPLTPAEIGLLRAWIDQGLVYSGTNQASHLVFSATPALEFTAVSGNKGKAREQLWQPDGWNGGADNFSLKQTLGLDSRLTLEGHALRDDYQLKLDLQKNDVGFIRGGFQQSRKYYSDAGGFDPLLTPGGYDLGRDLYLDRGKAWIDLEFTPPRGPKMVLGYEYQYREGDESTLQWGDVTAPGHERNIYPAAEHIDEKTHILKFDLTHEIAGVGLEDSFRAEFYDLQTRRANDLTMVQGSAGPSKLDSVQEGQHQNTEANILRIDKAVRDWFYLSGGWLYSRADGDGSFREQTLNGTGALTGGNYWRSQSIVLSQDSSFGNANARLGPWRGLVLSAGLQGESTRQTGLGQVSLDVGDPTVALTLEPATYNTSLQKTSFQELVNLAFNSIPFTTMTCDARTGQVLYRQNEQQVGAFNDFNVDNDTHQQLRDLRVGFQTSPHPKISWEAHYEDLDDNTHYNHLQDTSLGGPGYGYPAFITARRIYTKKAETKIILHPVSWLKTTLSYQKVDTDFTTDTDSLPGLTPGGALLAGRFRANVYGLGATLTPFRRWALMGSLNYYDSLMNTASGYSPAVVPYRGEILSALGSATYSASDRTQLTATYSFSHSDYGQNNYAGGLPVGMVYSQHALRAGVSHHFNHGVTGHLQYGFFLNDEPSSGGLNNYTAHAVFASVTMAWP